MTIIQSIKRSEYRKYSFNEDKLISKTPESLYWIGFLAADGCIYSAESKYMKTSYLKFSLAAKDKHQVENFIGFMECSANSIYNKSNNSYGITFTITDKLTNFLADEFNIKPRKSLTITPPNLSGIDSDYFIVGYIDGDGSWNVNKRDRLLRLGIRSTSSMLEWIRNRLDNVINSEKTNKISLSDGYPYYQISGKKAVEIYKYLCSLKLPVLSRKWCYDNYIF